MEGFKKANLYADVKTVEQKVAAWDKFVAQQNRLTDRYNIKKFLQARKIAEAKLTVTDAELEAEMKRQGIK